MSRLFRDEVLAARQAQYLGSIRIGANPSFALVTGIALVLAAGLVAYALLGEVTRRTRLAGLLVPLEGTLALSAPQAGTVSELRVKEGDAVSADQVLMAIRVDRATALGDAGQLIARNMEQRRATLQAERDIAEAQFRQRQQATADRARSLETEARQAEIELDGLQRRSELARKSVDRYGDLVKSGFVAEIQLQQKQEELLDVAGRRSTAERGLTALRRDLQALRADDAANASALQSQRIQIARNLASLDQEGNENSARRSLVVQAPEPGTVTAVTVVRGQAVQAGQTLAVVIPRAADGRPSALQAQLFAPSRTAGFVRLGQTVWIRYAAYPFQKFGMAQGTIDGISRTPLAVADLPAGQGQALMAAAQSNEPMYRITVSLPSQSILTYGEAQPLKPGMTLEADVVQERRRVWEWLFEPVLAASGFATMLALPAP